MSKLDDILKKAIADSTWKPLSREEEPRVNLTHWKVFQVTFPSGTTSIHFVGYTGYEGRVCSAVERYFPETKVGTTQSGRHYTLCGPPGSHPDAEWTWRRCCQMWKCTFVEITDQYYQEPKNESEPA